MICLLNYFCTLDLVKYSYWFRCNISVFVISLSSDCAKSCEFLLRHMLHFFLSFHGPSTSYVILSSSACVQAHTWSAFSIPIHPSALTVLWDPMQLVELPLEKTAAKFYTIFQSALIVKPLDFQKCSYSMLYRISPKKKCRGRSLLPGFADEEMLFQPCLGISCNSILDKVKWVE